MTFISKISVLLLAIIATSTQIVQAKGNKSVYVFGVSTSFRDSTAYITAIQQLDSVMIDDKSNALSGVHRLNKQLNSYIRSVNISEQMQALYYSESKKDIEKQFVKVQKKLDSDKTYKLTTISKDLFSYSYERISEVYGVTHRLEEKKSDEE